MTREEFVGQLRRLQPLAEADPAAYRRRVWWWAVLGYAGVLGLLFGSAGLVVLVLLLGFAVGASGLIIKLAAIPAFFAGKVFMSMWVKFEPPTGLRLRRAEAAPLLALLNQQARQLRAPRVHRVLLSGEFNASAVQVPRLGPLGWSRNYVVVGLPLLQALTPEQAAAVVAHELGHLRGGDGRFGAWVYRVGQTWAQLIQQLERQDRQSMFSRFTAWYVPRFEAWSHPLRRTQEFAADAAAARVTSPAAMAAALCALVVRDAALDKQYWDPLAARLAEQAAPPADCFSQLLPVAKTARLEAEEEQRLLREAFEADPDPFSTHPTLGERLQALGQAPAVPAPPAHTAAEAWLGAALPQLTAQLDAQWHTDRREVWEARHAELQRQLQRLRELDARHAAGDALTPDEQWERADLTEDHVGGREALPLFQALIDEPKWRVAACFSLGRVLTNLDDPAGLPWLQEVMDQEPQYVAAGLTIQEAYYLRRGERETVRQLGDAQLRHADQFDEAAAEREAVRPGDLLLAHGLTAEQADALVAQLRRPEYTVAEAWLLRKQVRYFTHKPLYVLVVAPPAAMQPRPLADSHAWVQQLARELELPGETFVVSTGTGKDNAWIEKAARQMPGAALTLH
ncbi:hypothetical protein EJV47_02335 [Hymenobacter gummosus]|uniref:Peptidase M48 domain-containing protein n=1 Tax=Hymenobacter gummosus TaxID=1776032 RepID=A0A431U9V0_9BACT|nr:M48 family metalloprotease [Hymenobacter gummosus]RTQ53596.1 hypothetical protein EJV47_02335 [Hymenobacter gummosus]